MIVDVVGLQEPIEFKTRAESEEPAGLESGQLAGLISGDRERSTAFRAGSGRCVKSFGNSTVISTFNFSLLAKV